MRFTRVYALVFPNLVLLSLATLLLLSGCASGLKSRVQELEQRSVDQESELLSMQRQLQSVDKKATDLHEQNRNLLSEIDSRLGKGEKLDMVNSREVFFRLNEYELSSEAQAELDRVAQEMAEQPGTVLEIIGQTDALGSTRYNFWLAERRSEEARRYLREKYGIPVNRLETVSYGESKAARLGDQQMESGNQADRRVLLNLWNKTVTKPEESQQPTGEDIS